jgi:membrane protein implicated in regulation of membrane protease activity
MVIQVELLVLLLAAVFLTIMPEVALAALAAAFIWARDFALAYRPVVAFVGLLLVAILTWTTLALRRAPSAVEIASEEDEEENRAGLRRAA